MSQRSNWSTCWERFDREVHLLVDEADPAQGPRQVTWDFRDDDGEALPSVNIENYWGPGIALAVAPAPAGLATCVVMGETSMRRIVHHHT